MKAKRTPIRGRGRPTKQLLSVRSEVRATNGITKHSRRRAPKPQRNSGEPGFDPEAFLTQTGLGRTVLGLQKSEHVFAQGDPADAIFYVQKGQIKVTVASKNGKEATIALAGAGDFLGEDSIASNHTLRLATAAFPRSPVRGSHLDVLSAIHLLRSRPLGHRHKGATGVIRQHDVTATHRDRSVIDAPHSLSLQSLTCWVRPRRAFQA